MRPVYDSETCDLIRDLQVPLLANSTDYLRGVGFFASGWLRLAARGLVSLVEKGGKARIVVSPVLESADWDALKLGEAARIDAVLHEVLARAVSDLSKTLEKDTRNALAWMVADRVLEFRFAVPREREMASDYHDKVGVFTDILGDRVAIHGSLNDSVKGSLNGEAFSVFVSWESGQMAYVEEHHSRLEALWGDRNRQFSVRRIPEAIRERLVRLRDTLERPYRLPTRVRDCVLSLEPRCPVRLRDYQEAAIRQWREAGRRGIFEMATGTGKTATALAAAVDTFSQEGRLALVVLVPYLHLLEQWEHNCREFGFNPVVCSGEHGRWQIDVRAAIQDLNIGARAHICILAVHKTAALDRFSVATSRLPEKRTMLIGDEAHGLGSRTLCKALMERAAFRLGLSATPRRWFDDVGTERVFSFFGPVCFEFPLAQAIGLYLTRYEYRPQLISLDDDEADKYEELTSRVLALAPSAEHDPAARERVRRLLLQRATIISRASAKLPAFISILSSVLHEDRQQQRESNGILVYCAPGTHADVLQKVSALGLRSHEFVHTTSLSERERLLARFAEGDIQALVAVRCLDEGVDVPSTRVAFILASSTNPREFVQRRGRILRPSSGKDRAFVYDFLVVPPPDRIDGRRAADLGALQREMPRFAEFSSSAMNCFEARTAVRGILDRLGMLHLMDETPWQVYHTLKQWDWSGDD